MVRHRAGLNPVLTIRGVQQPLVAACSLQGPAGLRIDEAKHPHLFVARLEISQLRGPGLSTVRRIEDRATPQLPRADRQPTGLFGDKVSVVYPNVSLNVDFIEDRLVPRRLVLGESPARGEKEKNVPFHTHPLFKP